MRLVAQIEKISGKNLPPATLLQAPTVEQLANLSAKKNVKHLGDHWWYSP